MAWINDFLKRISALKAKATGSTSTPKAALPEPPKTPATQPAAETTPPSAHPVVVSASRGGLKSNAERWGMFMIRQEHRVELEAAAARMKKARQRIESFIDENPIFAGVPWWAIAVLQEREASGRYDRHAHNGDPLDRPTVNVPANRPPGWMSLVSSDRTWERSALDAYTVVDKLQKKDWSTPGSALDALEAFNGMGYRNHGVPSAYLWSYTDQYTKGGYPADGKWSDSYVSRQPGCAALMALVGAFPR